MNRRDFITQTTLAASALMLPGCSRFSRNAKTIPGRIVGASAAAGHRLRFGPLPAATEDLQVEVAVLGGGIAGLAAARKLTQLGVSDLLLLELENETGGNAQSGRNSVSAFPWGAHYLPLPNEESTEVTVLLEELGLITGHAANGQPIFDEFALCSDPMERLFVNGEWQEGFIPHLDISAADRAQIDVFLTQMDGWRRARGSDGRRAFAIPVDLSSTDASIRALDRITMADYLEQQSWTAEPLRWYVNYCCRDDYGAGSDHVSAWAGIHYFASRNGHAANAPSSSVLTWPEGNGWLAQKLRAPLNGKVRTQALVWKIEPRDNGVTATYLDLARETSVRVHARAAVCAMPRFIAERLISANSDVPAPSASPLTYSPWMVANLTLDRIPGAPSSMPAWDNVFRASHSLGYVDATHQSLAQRPQATVLTYYQPLDDLPPAKAREAALPRSHRDWSEQIVADLETAHPGIHDSITNLDVWLWGHAMIRPTPGFIWGDRRAGMQVPLGRLAFAHSDMSGLSIFEEAYTRGVTTASAVLKQIRS
jgi:hypothetical protein